MGNGETLVDYEKNDAQRICLYAERNFDAKAVADRLLRVYGRVVGGPGRVLEA